MTQFPQVKMLLIGWFETYLIQNEFSKRFLVRNFRKNVIFAIFSEENLEPISYVLYIDENQNVWIWVALKRAD